MAGQNRLSARTAATRKPGRYCDGGGLYLIVSETGRKWVFRFTRPGGKVTEMGLGSADLVSLSEARKKALEARRLVAARIDPIAQRKAVSRSRMTFGECFREYIEAKQSSWRNRVHRDQWASTLDAYCAAIRDMPIDEVDTLAVLATLKPIWAIIPSTARRVRGRLENVLDYATAHNWRTGENPARWRGHLQSILPPRQKLEKAHHRALSYQKIPALMARLRKKAFATNRALQFTILCATRTSETLGARFEEFDLDAALWTIPAMRTKTCETHRIPLSEPALAIVRHAAKIRTSDFVFPGRRANQPLSRTVMITELRRLGVASTTHGLRSSFRDWAGDETNFPREICEAALGHVVGGRTERAYRRSDALERRRQLMQAWASFCEPATDSKVVSIVRGSR